MQKTEELKSSLMNLIKKEKKYRFIHINPGFVSDFGHHLTFNKKLNRLIASDDGDFIVLSNRELNDRFRKDLNVLPTFTYSTWGLVRDGNSSKYHTSFYHELLYIAELINIVDPVTRNIFFMYLTDSRHIPLIIDIAKALSNGRNFFILNLFHIYSEFSRVKSKFGMLSYESYMTLTTTAKIRRRYNISLSVETDILQKEILDYIDESLPIMPIYFSRLDEAGVNIEQKTVPANKPVLHVYLPSVSPERGYESVCALILFTRQKKTSSLFKFIIRNQYKDNENVKQVLEKVKDHCEIIEGILPEKRYTQLILEADAILIPYKKEEFYGRTSGVYVDAVLAGKPVVAAALTWMAQEVLKYNNGVIFPEDDTEAFHEALLKLYHNFSTYSQNTVTARKEWLKNNNGRAFLNFIKSNSIHKFTPTGEPEIITREWDLFNLQRIIQYKNTIIDEITKEREGIFEKKGQMIENRDNKILQQSETLKKKDEMIKNRDNKILQQSETLKKQDEMIKNRDNKIQQQKETLKKKDEELENQLALIKAKDRSIKNQEEMFKKNEAIIREKNKLIQQQSEMLTNREKLLAQILKMNPIEQHEE
jgi:glycosyltransferase involved in cell wall biosynthesis